ncbi:hypothetical protein VEx25_1656 [Vibrio antiquarius]|uniref:Uncharacterized protein n=1 Tax=Vibrio antiquarius (strain Ex25) TaxID=150340 RepID=A0ABM9WRM5_VIBAE|nr:hypothetical protein VEx25_1656 [Vibrio antiquarius]
MVALTIASVCSTLTLLKKTTLLLVVASLKPSKKRKSLTLANR